MANANALWPKPLQSIISNVVLLIWIAQCFYTKIFLSHLHHINFTCNSVQTKGLVKYVVIVEGAFINVSKYFWRTLLKESFSCCSKAIPLALNVIMVQYSFRQKFDPATSYFRCSSTAFLTLLAIKCPLAEFLTFNISN